MDQASRSDAAAMPEPIAEAARVAYPPVPTHGAGPFVMPEPMPKAARVAWWPALLALAVTAVLSLILPCERMKLHRADLTVPLAYGHDSFLIHCWVKTLSDTGWWITTDRCGAPYGHQMYDFPTNPTLHMAILRGMLLFSRDPSVLINAYFILCFPLVGVCAHAALRSMRFAHLYCILGGVLYACQPYHFWRGEPHLFLAAYFLLPLTTIVMVWLHRGEELFLRRNAEGRWRPVYNPRSLAAAAIITAQGFDFPYFSVFAGVFLATAGGVAFALHRDRIVAARTAILIAILAAAFLTSLSPNLLYYYQNGTNPSSSHVTHHPWSDGEEFALKPVQLLLPAPEHPVPAMERIRSKYYAGTKLASESDSMAMGTSAGVGFLILLACVPLGYRSRGERGRLFHLLGVLLVAGIVFCTAGGVGTMFNLLSLTVVRCYCRCSVFLAFFCLAAYCGALDSLYRSWFERAAWRRVLAALGVAGVLYLGFRDQAGIVYIKPFGPVQEEYRNDQEFVGRVEESMPDNAMVFQYPYIAYGSYTNAPVDMLPYSHFRGYVHSHRVRFSFGAMHGRPGDDLQANVAAIPTLEGQFRALAVLGFEGIWVDRFGYADRGAAIEKLLKPLAVGDPIISRNNRLAFYNLTGYRKSVLAGLSESQLARMRREIEIFPTVDWKKKFYPEETANVENWRRWRWCGSDGAVEFKNRSDETQWMRLRMKLYSHTGTSRVDMGGLGIEETLAVPDAGVVFERNIEVPPGTHGLTFRCQGHSLTQSDRADSTYFRVADFTLERIPEPGVPR